MIKVTKVDSRNMMEHGKSEGFIKINLLVFTVFLGTVGSFGISRGLNSPSPELTFKSVQNEIQRIPASAKVSAIQPEKSAKKISVATKTTSKKTSQGRKNIIVSKKTYMDCQSSTVLIPRVVLKAKRTRDLLTQFEVILVDENGKSSVFQSQDSLDWRFLDPQTLQNKNILIVGNSKETIRKNGMIEKGTAVSIFESMDSTEDMACLSVENRVGHNLGMPGAPPLKNRQLLNEARYQKFSGTLYHKDKLVPLTCFSPMLPRESTCGPSSDLSQVGDDELSAL
ncbi:MAG: hypothetical protein JNM39_07935 [Bdellovibrionaceae bacterium]|nr:hypothetical protein [Pseudobdellovibrionaceae bacterium]